MLLAATGGGDVVAPDLRHLAAHERARWLGKAASAFDAASNSALLNGFTGSASMAVARREGKRFEP